MLRLIEFIANVSGSHASMMRSRLAWCGSKSIVVVRSLLLATFGRR
jgi:hypothetical protein